MPRSRLEGFICQGCRTERASAVFPEGWLRAIVYGNRDGHGATRIATATACSLECLAPALRARVEGPT